MNVRDIIPDSRALKAVQIMNLIKRKKKNNPPANKTGPMLRTPDDSYGISGGGDSGGDPQGSIV